MPAPDPVSLRETLESVVRASHEALLGRRVDATWLANFTDELVRQLRTKSLTNVMADFIQLILGSPEGQKHLVTAAKSGGLIEDVVAPGLAARPSPLACIALGCAPQTAGMLRRAGLRRWAGPFDWMTIPAEAVRDSIIDDCAGLLMAAEYEPIDEADRPPGSQGHLCRHRRYSELYGATIFHHYDPSTPQGYAALERAALRLRDALRGLHGKLLLQVTDETGASLAAFEDTCDMLDRSARGAILVTIAVVPGSPSGPFPEMELSRARGQHRFLRCHTLSEPQGIGYGDLIDEVVLLRGALAAPQLTG
ncbi:hypothetical protein [Roseococcus sp.]|uniref:hypothetical protein n=1 Tax=Roseococcus sp. TaxID=2109646 RepID=UPI003BACD9CC